MDSGYWQIAVVKKKHVLPFSGILFRFCDNGNKKMILFGELKGMQFYKRKQCFHVVKWVLVLDFTYNFKTS